MATDAAKPSDAAMWAAAASGVVKHDVEEEEAQTDKPVQKPKPDDGRKRSHHAPTVASRVNKESDARLVAQMQARFQREQQELHMRLIQRQAQQAQAQSQSPPPMPQPILIRQVAQVQAQAPRPRPKWRGMEKTARMLTDSGTRRWKQKSR